MAEEWKSCTVGWVGPAADGSETSEPVIYINLTDTGGAFNQFWFFAADNAKTEMLAVALMARALGLPVQAAIDSPNPGGSPYTQIYRLYLE